MKKVYSKILCFVYFQVLQLSRKRCVVAPQRFTMIIFAWWHRTSSKLSGKHWQSKKQPVNSERDNS